MADVTTEPTAAPRTFIGGSFAPPLDENNLAAYRTLATEAGGQVADAMGKLCDMVALFQQSSPSRLTGTPHPAHARAIIVPLEAAEVKRIWDAVPWATEIEMLKSVFDNIENVVSARNTEKLRAWRQAVSEQAYSVAFPGVPVSELVRRFAFVEQAEESGMDTAAVDKIVETLFHLPSMELLRERFEEGIRIRAAALASSAGRPQLETTKIRDAAHHLLWFAVELEKDREPLTSDKL